MKVIVNGVSDKPCFKCEGKENVRWVNSPTENFTGPLCLGCVGKKTNEPVQKIVRKKKAAK
jgi:hypothetical protein